MSNDCGPDYPDLKWDEIIIPDGGSCDLPTTDRPARVLVEERSSQVEDSTVISIDNLFVQGPDVSLTCLEHAGTPHGDPEAVNVDGIVEAFSFYQIPDVTADQEKFISRTISVEMVEKIRSATVTVGELEAAWLLNKKQAQYLVSFLIKTYNRLDIAAQKLAAEILDCYWLSEEVIIPCPPDGRTITVDYPGLQPGPATILRVGGDSVIAADAFLSRHSQADADQKALAAARSAFRCKYCNAEFSLPCELPAYPADFTDFSLELTTVPANTVCTSSVDSTESLLLALDPSPLNCYYCIQPPDLDRPECPPIEDRPQLGPRGLLISNPEAVEDCVPPAVGRFRRGETGVTDVSFTTPWCYSSLDDALCFSEDNLSNFDPELDCLYGNKAAECSCGVFPPDLWEFYDLSKTTASVPAGTFYGRSSELSQLDTQAEELCESLLVCTVHNLPRECECADDIPAGWGFVDISKTSAFVNSHTFVDDVENTPALDIELEEICQGKLVCTIENKARTCECGVTPPSGWRFVDISKTSAAVAAGFLTDDVEYDTATLDSQLSDICESLLDCDIGNTERRCRCPLFPNPDEPDVDEQINLQWTPAAILGGVVEPWTITGSVFTLDTGAADEVLAEQCYSQLFCEYGNKAHPCDCPDLTGVYIPETKKSTYQEGLLREILIDRPRVIPTNQSVLSHAVPRDQVTSTELTKEAALILKAEVRESCEEGLICEFTHTRAACSCFGSKPGEEALYPDFFDDDYLPNYDLCLRTPTSQWWNIVDRGEVFTFDSREEITVQDMEDFGSALVSTCTAGLSCVFSLPAAQCGCAEDGIFDADTDDGTPGPAEEEPSGTGIVRAFKYPSLEPGLSKERTNNNQGIWSNFVPLNTFVYDAADFEDEDEDEDEFTNRHQKLNCPARYSLTEELAATDLNEIPINFCLESLKCAFTNVDKATKNCEEGVDGRNVITLNPGEVEPGTVVVFDEVSPRADDLAEEIAEELKKCAWYNDESLRECDGENEITVREGRVPERTIISEFSQESAQIQADNLAQLLLVCRTPDDGGDDDDDDDDGGGGGPCDCPIGEQGALYIGEEFTAPGGDDYYEEIEADLVQAWNLGLVMTDWETRIKVSNTLPDVLGGQGGFVFRKLLLNDEGDPAFMQELNGADLSLREYNFKFRPLMQKWFDLGDGVEGAGPTDDPSLDVSQIRIIEAGEVIRIEGNDARGKLTQEGAELLAWNDGLVTTTGTKSLNPVLHPWRVSYLGLDTLQYPPQPQWKVAGGDVWDGITGTALTVADTTVTGDYGFVLLRITRDSASRVITEVEVMTGLHPAVIVSDGQYQYRALAYVDSIGGAKVYQMQFEEIRIHELMLVKNGEFSLAGLEMSHRNTYDPPA